MCKEGRFTSYNVIKQLVSSRNYNVIKQLVSSRNSFFLEHLFSYSYKFIRTS